MGRAGGILNEYGGADFYYPMLEARLAGKPIRAEPIVGRIRGDEVRSGREAFAYVCL